MALPPEGDPQRPLHLAVRSTRILGIVFIVLGAVGMLPTLLGIQRAGGIRLSIASLILLALFMSLVYFGPGALYLVCSIHIARRRKWAVVTAMVLAGIQLLLILAGVVMMTFMAFSDAPAALKWTLILPAAVTLLIFLALAQLEYHLSKCFEAIRLAPLDVQRGFDPLPAAPLVPAALVSGDDDAPPAAR